MAGRGHVDVNERRLKPIYDYIDNRNYKKAVQEADRVLKKQKDLHCAKALKGLALIRQGKQDAGMELLQEVHSQHPTDDATLQAVTISYGEMQEFDLIADLYEHANKLKPDNEDLLSALFMAYVRIGSYQKQQRTAMSLHKLKPDKNPYYFWALMSIVMQAHAAEDETKKMTFLKLAERMAEKFISSKKVEAEAEVMMYLMILELLGKYSESLELINGPLGAKFQELNYRSSHSAELYMKLGQWQRVNVAYKSLIANEPDQWCYYQNYLLSVLHLSSSDYVSNPDDKIEGDVTIDDSPSLAQTFIKSRITAIEESGKKARAPYLAELELIKLLKAENLSFESLSNVYDLVYKYCLLYWNKACCYGDLKPYVHLLSGEELVTLTDKLESDLGFGKSGSEPVYPEDEASMWRHLTTCFFRHHLPSTWSQNVEEALVLAQEYCMRHEDGLKFGKDRLKTDYQPCDDYLLLATTIYNHLYCQSGKNVEYLWTVIGLLERGLVFSPSNFKFKILLVHYYCILGAFSSASEHWETLDVKHIQHDSIGYVIMNHVVRFGHYPRAGDILSAMLKFFTINNKDTTDFLISSYKYGSFNKIHEFVRFRQRLQNSFQFASATAEKLHMDLLTDGGTDAGMSVLLEIDPENETNYADLMDNRDLNVLQLPHHPDMPKNDDFKGESFEEEKNWIKIRNLTIRMMAAASQFDTDGNVTILSNPGVKNGNQPARCMQEVLSELMVQLQEHVTELDPKFGTESKYPLTGLFRTRITQYITESHSTILIEFCKCLLHLYKFSIKTELEEKIKFTCCDRLSELVDNLVPCCAVEKEDIHFDAKHLERLVMITELLCQATLLTVIAYKVLKPLKTPGHKRGSKKGQKKANAATDLNEITGNFNGLVAKLKTCFETMETVLEESQGAILKLTVQGFEKMSVLENEQKWETRHACMKKVLASYQISIGNLTQILHRKKSCLQNFPS